MRDVAPEAVRVRPRSTAQRTRSWAVAVAGAVDRLDRVERRSATAGNFRRIRLTWLSIVRSLTDTRSGYAASISCSRVCTTPGRRASACSSRNSVTVSGTARAFHVAVSRSAVQHERADGAHVLARRPASVTPVDRRATQQHLDARHQLAHRERLAEVVVGANLEAEHAIELLLARGDEDDRQRSPSGRAAAGTARGRRAAAGRCRA